MMNLIDRIEAITEEAKNYAEAKYQNIRLDSIQKSVEASSTLITWLVVGVVAFIVLLLFTFLGGIVLSEALGSYLFGFGIITIAYVLLLVLIIVYRKKWVTSKIQDILYGFFTK